MEYDFEGWATMHDMVCSDGLTIKEQAFAHCDGRIVPLVWSHGDLEDEDNVLGLAYLKHQKEGVRVFALFNDSENGQKAKQAVKAGKINQLSIYANRLLKHGNNVMHGEIVEVSLVLRGANPGAFIDYATIKHGEGFDVLEDEGIIYTGLELRHNDSGEEMAPKTGTKNPGFAQKDLEKLLHAQTGTKTVEEIFESLDEDQKELFHAMVGLAATQGAEVDEDEDLEHQEEQGKPKAPAAPKKEGEELSHGKKEGGTVNVFEQNKGTEEELKHQQGPTLSKEQLKTIVDYAKKNGSLKEAFLKHAEDYGITNIDLLFPDAKSVTDRPDFVKRRTEWVQKVLGGVKQVPFSRIKTMFADITHDEARAKGYIKGNMKKEEFFGLTKRITTPATVYKKQKLDRDDIVDITDFDVVAWIKAEMRLMLDEEIARAILIGDGREVDDEDKVRDPGPSVSEGAGIRAIAHDHEFYAHPIVLAANVSAKDAEQAIIRSLDNYRGLGSPTMFTTRGFMNDLLLREDKMGRPLYDTRSKLADKLGVQEIVDVEVMNTEPEILAIIVNLQDYSVGTDRGGEINYFDDFDIDYNQYKYLYEGRMSGALTKWKSAIIIRRSEGTLATPGVPTFVSSTGVVTIPNITGVQYYNKDTDTLLTAGAQTAIAAGATVEIEARPATGYYFEYNLDTDWEFTRDA